MAYKTGVGVFGMMATSSALVIPLTLFFIGTRLWALGWACALGCGFSSVNGLWAIWSRQTAPVGTPGPGVGLILTLLAMILLSFLWVRLAWTRPGGRAEG